MSLELVPPHGEAAPCPGCVRLRNAIALIEVDLQNVEVSLRSERRRTTLLQGQLDKLLDESAEADEVREIFQIWRGATNHPKSKLLAERKKLIGKMLKHYGRDRCVMAVLGAEVAAYTNPATGVRYDQIKHIFGDEEKFERFEAAGRRAFAPQLEAKRRSTSIAQVLRDAGMRGIDDEAMGVTHFKCPLCHAADDDPLYHPLVIRYDGKAGYCRECFATVTDVIRAVGVGERTLFEVAA